MEWSTDLSTYPTYWHSRLKRGFGLGTGSNYRPWLRVRDVPSDGSSGNPKGITTGRTYHLLSKLERIYFHYLDRQPDVVDIREQFPILALSETQSLCAELGVKHPAAGRYPEPFTFDFLVTRQKEGRLVYQARSIKTPGDAADEKTRAKLNVEYQWSERNALDWKLVDVSGFSDDLQSTLVFMRGWFSHRYSADERIANDFSQMFLKLYEPNVPLKELIQACASRMKRGYSLAQNDFRYCAWAGLIPVKLNSKLTMHLPVTLDGKR
ncbi:TnsA endonuclease N-terminal domain-containing protein [Collimonas sp. OK307]|uniref:TnsA endonuclease N-terminal domain-containing protein n=1 Tax=Collimonas sp. OK307 TaxID=1801620 RepID=UPI000B836186|nr:TnsA endonuclease N-terminal domain-containing protein [Collimonas sp. OK307]